VAEVEAPVECDETSEVRVPLCAANVAPPEVHRVLASKTLARLLPRVCVREAEDRAKFDLRYAAGFQRQGFRCPSLACSKMDG